MKNTELPKYKSDTSEKIMIIKGSVTFCVGAVLIILALFVFEIEWSWVIGMCLLGMVCLGFGCGYFAGLGAMREGILKHLEKVGAIRLVGKKGKEIIEYIPMKYESKIKDSE